MTIDAQKFPVAAVRRVVVVVMVFVVNSKLTKPYAREFAAASGADRRVDFEGSIAIACGALLSIPLSLPKDLIESSTARCRSFWSSHVVIVAPAGRCVNRCRDRILARNFAMDYCNNSPCRRRNDFQKGDRQGETPFCTSVFPLDPLSENSKMIAEWQ